jgi:membrane protease YdiL (CAAX protease family)
MKSFANCLFILASIFVVPWPLTLLLSAYAFDEPSKSATFELVRCGIVALLLTYPLGYLVVLRARWRARKNGEDWRTARNIRFLLMPFLQVGGIFVIGYFYGDG